MKQFNFQRTYFITTMVLFMCWTILLPCGIGVCGSAAVVIVGERLARSVVDCEKYVFHPHCRGLQAKKKRIIDKTIDRTYDESNNNYNYDNNNNNNNIHNIKNNNNYNNYNNDNYNDNDNEKTGNLCVCKYWAKNNNSWQKDLRSIGLAKLFKEVMPTAVIINDKGHLIKPAFGNYGNENYNETPTVLTLSPVTSKVHQDNFIKNRYTRSGTHHYQLLRQHELNKMNKVKPNAFDPSHTDVHIYIHI